MRVTEVERSHEPAVPGAATVDAVGWGVFLMWVGIALFAQVGWAIFFFGAGVLVLAGQAVRTRIGSRADWFALALGAFLVVAGGSRALELPLEEVLVPTWFVPSMFIAVGVAIVVTAWRRRRKG